MHLHVDDSRCRLCSVLTLCLVARSEASAEAPKAMRNPEFQIFDFVHSKCKMVVIGFTGKGKCGKGGKGKGKSYLYHTLGKGKGKGKASLPTIW